MSKGGLKIGWCPPGVDGTKQGVDDLLARGAAVEDLEHYLKTFGGTEGISRDKPILAKEAYYGLAGKIVNQILPETEADPAALLSSLLIYCGCYIGRDEPYGAFFKVEGKRHYCKEYTVLVGKTAKGRKGVSQGRIEELVKNVDPNFMANNRASGLSSGEGLIYRVRNEVSRKNKEGEKELVDEGVDDKRLLVTESEFASTLTVMRREGNTLKDVIRNGWDDEILGTMTRNNSMKSTGSHISIIGHITESELKKHLTEEKLGGGIANRFLFMMVHRSKMLPHGGDPDPVNPKTKKRLMEALQFGKEAGEIKLSEEPEEDHGGISANDLWCDVYGGLTEGETGLLGSVINRGEVHVRRIATIYAVLDKSKTVKVDHLLAGLAVWQYAEDSSRIIFGKLTGDPVADAIEEELRLMDEEGLSKTEISSIFGRNYPAKRINAALGSLMEQKKITMKKEKGEGPGAPKTRFYHAQV